MIINLSPSELFVFHLFPSLSVEEEKAICCRYYIIIQQRWANLQKLTIKPTTVPSELLVSHSYCCSWSSCCPTSKTKYLPAHLDLQHPRPHAGTLLHRLRLTRAAALVLGSLHDGSGLHHHAADHPLRGHKPLPSASHHLQYGLPHSAIVLHVVSCFLYSHHSRWQYENIWVVFNLCSFLPTVSEIAVALYTARA